MAEDHSGAAVARPAATPKGCVVEVAPWPEVDFSAFGDIEPRPLSRVQQFVGGFLSRNWVKIPHVTHHDEADITAAEVWRKQWSDMHSDVKLTSLVLLVKAVVSALKAYPHFNASLDADGKTLVLKKFFHIGIAVDTPNGLLVPVIRDCDRKDIKSLAREIAAISAKAREKGLSMAEMSGGCFSISSLGGIGGTPFTPIINAPEVAILGVCRTQEKPVRSVEDNGIAWRKMLPLSLSYDHRVINGADAARFTRHIAETLQNPVHFA